MRQQTGRGSINIGCTGREATGGVFQNLSHCRETHGVSAELNGDVDGVEGFAEQAAKGLEGSIFAGSIWGSDSALWHFIPLLDHTEAVEIVEVWRRCLRMIYHPRT